MINFAWIHRELGQPTPLKLLVSWRPLICTMWGLPWNSASSKHAHSSRHVGALRCIVLGDGETNIASFNQSSTIEISNWIRKFGYPMLQKKKKCVFFQVFFVFFCFNDCLETLTWETSNQKWQCPTDQGQALFRAMQMWEVHLLRSGSCSAEAAGKNLREAGNLWNLLVFRPWDLFKICFAFFDGKVWLVKSNHVLYPSRMGFSEDLEEWVQLYSDSDHLVKESDIYVTSVLVVYPEIQASCSYFKVYDCVRWQLSLDPQPGKAMLNCLLGDKGFHK